MRSVGRNVYFELSRSSAPDAKTAGARVRTASSERLRSKALAWEENERLEMAFMMESSRESWAGLPAAGRSRGAQQSRIKDRPWRRAPRDKLRRASNPALSLFRLLPLRGRSKFLLWDDRYSDGWSPVTRV